MSDERKAIGLNLGVVTLIVVLLIQTASMFYWAGEIRQMVTDHERRIGMLESQHREHERAADSTDSTRRTNALPRR